ncbi:MAG: chemotaxis protein CheR, partial [Oscillospiraceae bacterium]
MPTLTDADFLRLSQFIQKNYGINLSQKRQLITSRLTGAILARGYADFAPFVEHLLQSKDESELTLLLDKLTTNYT